MYPNPQDVLPLPPRPDLDQYRKRAKELVAAVRAGEDAALAWAREWVMTLARLQQTGARPAQRDIERRTLQVAHFAWDRLRTPDAGLSQAQFVIARAHGFESWPRLVGHVEELTAAASGTSTFERAADAIIDGDLLTLQRLIAADPALVRARSGREHRATLLHYTAANGVENYRQRTPANITIIAQYLLDAGAEVDAEADVYGGGQTTFSLAVTSAHPRAAGVQNALADLLLSRGARMDSRIVHSCLVNGCPEVAAHLATRGAPVGIIEAAGIGRLDLLRQAFQDPKAVSAADRGAAMVMAAWSGQRNAIALMLELGVEAGVQRPHDRQTALHAAAFQGDAELVDLLLRHRAPLEVADGVYGTTPIVWALHAWLVEDRPGTEAYTRILHALVNAGSRVGRDTFDSDRVRADPLLHAALTRAAGAA